MMRTFTAILALCALAACSGEDTTQTDAGQVGEVGEVTPEGIDPAAEAGFEAVAPGNYEVVRADGTIDRLTILPGMLWSTAFADGSAAGGTIFAQDGQNCFVTEGVADHQCFDQAVPAEDGSMQITGPEGDVMTVRPVDSFE